VEAARDNNATEKDNLCVAGDFVVEYLYRNSRV